MANDVSEIEVTDEMLGAALEAARPFYFEEGYALTRECLAQVFRAMWRASPISH